MKIKLGLVACAFALGVGFSGCGLLDDEEKEAPKVELKSEASWTFSAGSTNEITGEIKASEPIDGVQIDVLDSEGNIVPSSVVDVDYPTISGVDSYKFKDKNFTIRVAGNAPSGSYKLDVSVIVGELENSTKIPFTVTGGTTGPSEPTGTPVTTDTIIAGAQGSSSGSSIDLDVGKAWSSTEAKNKGAEIDLCYSTTKDNVDKLGTPYWAKESNYGFAKDWTDLSQSSTFYKLDFTRDQFDAITKVEDIPGFEPDKATAISSEVNEGDVFIVKTSEGATALICITNKVPGAAGTITIKSSK